MPGAVAVILRSRSNKVKDMLRTEELSIGRSGVLNDFTVLTNWPLDSSALDSCYVRIKRFYYVSQSQPGILLPAVKTS